MLIPLNLAGEVRLYSGEPQRLWLISISVIRLWRPVCGIAVGLVSLEQLAWSFADPGGSANRQSTYRSSSALADHSLTGGVPNVQILIQRVGASA